MDGSEPSSVHTGRDGGRPCHGAVSSHRPSSTRPSASLGPSHSPSPRRPVLLGPARRSRGPSAASIETRAIENVVSVDSGTWVLEWSISILSCRGRGGGLKRRRRQRTASPFLEPPFTVPVAPSLLALPGDSLRPAHCRCSALGPLIQRSTRTPAPSPDPPRRLCPALGLPEHDSRCHAAASRALVHAVEPCTKIHANIIATASTASLHAGLARMHPHTSQSPRERVPL